MIPYSKQIIDKDDIKAVTKVLKSNFLTQGPMVEKFEKKIKKLVGAKYAIALNSATSGLHLSCLSLNLKKGDNVWTSINTFVSSANCALLCGAKVDFIDIDLDDYNLCIKDLKTKLLKAKKEKRLPKIIIPVHFAGRPCKMKEIYNLSKIYKFKIIEDASHALGSKVYNSYIGNCRHSDLAVFSFHPVKNITTGEGGVVTTNNKELCEKIRMLRTHGITKNRNKFSIKNSPPWHYEQLLLGYNYRMNDIEAALGVSQITKLKKFLINRNKIANFYNENLKNLNLILPKVDNKILNAFHLYPVRVNTLQAKKTRLKLFKYLRKKKFFINIHYIPVTKHSYFKKRGYNDSYSNMEAYYNTVISLPIFPNLNKKILSSIIKHIKVIVDEK
jgi:UDP-4-amino-4,6-dideoxy-N-acetyl-beta-L-altrosamine transaminase